MTANQVRCAIEHGFDDAPDSAAAIDSLRAGRSVVIHSGIGETAQTCIQAIIIAAIVAGAMMAALNSGISPVTVRVAVIAVVFGLVAVAMAIGLVLALLNPDPGRNREGPEAFYFLGCVGAFAILLLTPFTWLWVLQPISALAVVFFHANLIRIDHLETGSLLLHLACFYLSVRLCLGALVQQ